MNKGMELGFDSGRLGQKMLSPPPKKKKLGQKVLCPPLKNKQFPHA